MMNPHGETEAPFIERSREWLRETAQTWPRLQRFIEQMNDKMQARESGTGFQRQLPQEAHSIPELVCWLGQWLLGMAPAEMCDNTVGIARACQAFLFAGDLDQRASSPEIRGALEELLEHTHLMEAILLMQPSGTEKSRRLQRLGEAMQHQCLQLPAPGGDAAILPIMEDGAPASDRQM